MSEDPRTTLADALGDLAATLRFHRGLGFEAMSLEGEYLQGPAEALRGQEQRLQGCRKCKLCDGRHTIVFGSGNPEADLVVIGEGPGADEDAQGLPFVGRAGQLLTRMLASVDLTREEVFITNAVKCFISPRILIYTSAGYRPIKDLCVGDLVLTHRGRFRPVSYVRPKEMLPKGSEVIRFSIKAPDATKAKPFHMTVTPEHPFFVDGAWKAARDIRPGDSLRTLGDECEVCGSTFFVRHERYDHRPFKTCGVRCHNKRIFHSAEARAKIRKTLNEPYADGRRDASAIVRRANQRHRELVSAGLARIQNLTPNERRRGRVALAANITAGLRSGITGVGERELAAILTRMGVKHHRNEYVFADATVATVETRRTRADFRLYNIGVEEDESFIAGGLVSHNCRPPGNRNPEGDELAACAPFLAKQLAVIQPKVILTLGSVATQSLLRTKEPIGKLRGRLHRYGDAVLVATFHPAFLLRNPGQDYKRMAWDDLKLAKREYDARRT